MSVLPYPAYKESGVEWIGRIPVGWTVLSLKRDMEFLTSGSRGWAEHYADDGALFIRIGNLTRDGLGLDLSDIQRVTVPAGSEGERTRVRAGDVLFSITAFMGSVAVVPHGIEPAYVSQHVALTRIRGDLLSPKWVGYSTLSSAGKAYLDAQCYGGTKIQLSLDDVANLPIAVPPLDQQRVITAFLDRETGKIDALVTEQEQLMALLKEKRHAVISQAVTKGLNPNAKMKPSGVEWLGEVPEHWHIESARRLFIERDVRSVDGSEELLTVSHITGVTLRSEKNVNMIEAESNEGYKVCLPGDLVINTLWAWMGAMGVTSIHGIVSPAYNIYTPRPRIRTDYVSALVRMPVFAQEAERHSKGVWSSRLRLYPEGLFSIQMPVPPLDEQAAIAEHIDHVTGDFDVLSVEALRAITLLKERRAALISAAVTGKIDVCEFVAEPQAAA